MAAGRRAYGVKNYRNFNAMIRMGKNDYLQLDDASGFGHTPPS
jgi:hypothetical protein